MQEKAKEAFLIAACCGQIEVMQRLIKQFSATPTTTIITPAATATTKTPAATATITTVTTAIDVDMSDDSGFTALCKAAQNGRLNVVKWLVDVCKACVSHFTAGGWNATGLATVYGHLEVVKYLVKINGQIADKLGSSCLAVAAQNGHLSLVKWFIVEAKNDIDYKTWSGWSLLALAARNGRVNVVEWLLLKRADMNVGIGLKSPVWHACEVGHLEVLKLLLKYKCSLIDASLGAAQGGQLELMKWLVKECSINLNHHSEGWSVLGLACKFGRLLLVKWLIAQKAHASHVSNAGWSPLAISADAGHVNIVQFLLQSNAQINCLTSNNDTALNIAVANGHFAVVKLLVTSNAKLDMQSKDGLTALSLAVGGNYVEIVECLVKAGASLSSLVCSRWSLLALACARGHLETVKYLVRDAHVEVDDVQTDGKLALGLAVERGHIEVVRWLVLEARAAVNLSTSSPSIFALLSSPTVKFVPTSSTLMLALNQGNSKIVRFLIFSGAKLANPAAIFEVPFQGLLREALDKARIKLIRQVLCRVGWDRSTADLVGRYSMVSWTEAVVLLKESSSSPTFDFYSSSP